VNPSAVARIDASALQNNLAQARKAAPGCPVLAVVKANAYGHGLLGVAQVLSRTDALGVSRIEEGVLLRQANIRKPIVILNGFADRRGLEQSIEHRLQPVVHSEFQVALIEAMTGATPGSRLPIWLKVDTGMGRLGINAEQVRQIARRLRSCSMVAENLRLMTHLAWADDLENAATSNQLERFAEAAAGWEGDISIANSAGILGWPQTTRRGPELQYTGENWIRPGLMLYGVSPLLKKSAMELGLRPVMSFETRLIAIRSLKRGSRVGYGGDWIAKRDSKIGVAGAGYADGYPWRLGRGAPVLVNDRLTETVGRVSMDMISIDLTDLQSARVGDRVVLWGVEPQLANLAQLAGTSAYELLTGVGDRVRRQFDQQLRDGDRI
jgi:alanine racemase